MSKIKSKIVIILLLLLLIVLISMPIFYFHLANEQINSNKYNYNYEDGAYYVTFTHLNNLGWAPFLTMTVHNGEIISVNMDCVDAEGRLKSEDERYAKAMHDNTGTTPSESFSELEQALLKTQNINNVDALSGATHTSHWFKEMVVYALSHPESKDNVLSMNETYTSSYPSYNSHGWKGHLSIKYLSDEMIEVHYDEYNKQGISKKDDADYKSAMSEVCNTYPAKYTKELENRVLIQQSAEIDVISGATQSSNYFIHLAEEAISKRKRNPLTLPD